MPNLANDAVRGKRATRKRKVINVILGPYRLRGVTWIEATAMALNGYGFIREHGALRMIHSEAFEQGGRS
jgi:hypothetical protein